MARPFYLTTTLPYVNADPHIGFALELVQADILVRFRKLMGDEVFFNTGTDEHGLKIYRKALEEGKEPQRYVDEYAAKFRALKDKLDLFPDIHFIRTTDPHHVEAAQEFWKRCAEAGDIYKKNYQIKYCVGCEMEKTESELVDGYCPLHPTMELELIDEENYFFRWSKYQEPLLAMYAKHPEFVLPTFRFNEIKAFVERGLEDFSISRLVKKMPWGVPVPGDPDHVMYVWFDALVNYISTLGWPADEKQFEKFWGTKEIPNGLQMGGKDQVRQQSAMWQAMLMSANLPCSKQILIHGFITSGGQKMSKSIGNVIDPMVLIDEYGTDALRYFLARHVHPFEDTDVTLEKFKEVYNADLANGIGNLVSRVMQLASTYEVKMTSSVSNFKRVIQDPTFDSLDVYMSGYEFNSYISLIQERIKQLDVHIHETQPFKVIKEDEKRGKEMIRGLVDDVFEIAELLQPIMPSTSDVIKAAVLANKKPENLFPRKES